MVADACMNWSVRIAWVLGAFPLLWMGACGEIREVPVDQGDTGTEGGDDGVDGGSGTTEGGSTGGDTGAHTGPDQDTDGASSDDIGGDDGDTGAEDWAIFCELAVDEGAVSTTIVSVKGVQTAQDLRIGVRVHEGLLEPLRITLAHGDVTRILADVDDCVAPTDFWFSDEAAATPDAACESSTGMESMLTKPTQSLAPLLRGDVEGDWMMTIERTGRDQWLGLGSVCVALLP